MAKQDIDVLIGPNDAGNLSLHLRGAFRSSKDERAIHLKDGYDSWQGAWLITHVAGPGRVPEDEINNLVKLAKTECAKILILSDDPSLYDRMKARMTVAQAYGMNVFPDDSVAITAA